MKAQIIRIGNSQGIRIPKALLEESGIKGEVELVLADEGILIRPAVAVPVEIYSPERRAEFLLSTAVDATDYTRAVEEVRKMGLDPKTVPHQPPPGV